MIRPSTARSSHGAGESCPARPCRRIACHHPNQFPDRLLVANCRPSMDRVNMEPFPIRRIPPERKPTLANRKQQPKVKQRDGSTTNKRNVINLVLYVCVCQRKPNDPCSVTCSVSCAKPKKCETKRLLPAAVFI